MGLGERMKGAGDLVFDADGYPVSLDGGPPPDDETLERIRLQVERYRRLVPDGPAAPDAPRLDRPLIYKNRPKEQGARGRAV